MATVPSRASSDLHCPAVIEIGVLHAELFTSFPTLHCALPTNVDAYVQVPLKLAPIHDTIVPFPQSILIGVVAVVLFHLHAKLTLYPLPDTVGAEPAMLAQLALVSARLTELHA